MRNGILIFLIFLVSAKGHTQTLFFSDSNVYVKKDSFTFWKLIDVSGNVLLKGQYRRQNINRGTFKDLQKSTIYSGGILLNTKSCFWSPNFLLLDVTGEYNPESNRDMYLIIPDRAEVRTLNRLNMRATFFSSKPATVSTFLNFNNVYQNRENLTNVRSNSKSWGSSFSFNNKILPTNISFTKNKTNQVELQGNRDYYFDQTLFQANVSRSFTKYDDKHRLSYTRNEYNSKLWDINNVSRISEIRLNDDINFDFKKKYRLLSFVSLDNQNGTSLNQQRMRAYEKLFIKLPENLNFMGSYNYTNTAWDSIRTVHNNLYGILRHKLYQSLYTDIFYEYNNINSTLFKAVRNKAGFDLRYVKKIPLDGHLNITYNFFKQHYANTANNVSLQIIQEDHLLTDGLIILLDKPYIDPSTIMVFDVTGTILYQEGIDYALIKQNSYYEIRRIPGGLIPNNSTVYVNYTATQPGTYSYDINNHMASVSVTLWKNLFEVYYRFIKQDYSNLSYADYLTLNYITQNIVGTKLQYDFASGGVEYNYYNSTIVPYKMLRYFVDLQRNFNNKITAVLVANLRDYNLLDDSVRNKYYDISGRVSYRIKSLTDISLSGSYMKQDIYNTEMNVLVLGMKLTSAYRKLYFTLGVDFYYRDYLNEEFKLKGIYFKVSRKF